MRRFQVVLVFLMVVLGGQSVMAATYYVGDCPKATYGSIQAAVNGVAAGSTLNICPGTYPEQITISKALTLQAVSYNNSSQAIITVPSGGLTTTTSITPLGTIAAQVEVTAGPVNITGITVDGTALGSNCPSVDMVGIFYNSGSSGALSDSQIVNQDCNSIPIIGIGILAEDGPGASKSVTIENNSIYSAGLRGDAVGVWVDSNQAPSTLTALIKGNLTTGEIVVGFNVIGSVSGNTIAFSNVGIVSVSSSMSITGNTVVQAFQYGIDVQAPGVVSSNHILGTTEYGIYLETEGATIENNIITNTGLVGIEFNCNTATVKGNTINGAPTGLDMVPLGFTGTNKFYSVPAVSTRGCE
ncbi:MAG TPA: right-handed parallel beta-helix repeat-containing protein [Terriglobales bacterium]